MGIDLEEIERRVPDRELLRQDRDAFIKFIKANGWTYARPYLFIAGAEWWCRDDGQGPFAELVLPQSNREYAWYVDRILDRIQATRDDEATILRLVKWAKKLSRPFYPDEY